MTDKTLCRARHRPRNKTEISTPQKLEEGAVRDLRAGWACRTVEATEDCSEGIGAEDMVTVAPALPADSEDAKLGPRPLSKGMETAKGGWGVGAGGWNPGAPEFRTHNIFEGWAVIGRVTFPERRSCISRRGHDTRQLMPLLAVRILPAQLVPLLSHGGFSRCDRHLSGTCGINETGAGNVRRLCHSTTRTVF